ncbi:MAG: ParA family protein [Acetatifactor sp.]|nr:ParA family protein [Acetatifactor sp.]
MTRVISIINLKGGVGKTFTAANMAHILSGHGKSVLLVDNDKQGNLSKLFGVYQDETESGTAKLLRGWYQDINSLRYCLPGYAGMDIIPANMSLLQATNDLTREESEDQVERFKALKEAYPLEEGKPYDFIIIDNPPDLGLNVINALAVSDDVIVPTKIDAWALEGLDVIIEQVGQMQQLNSGLQFRGVLPTMWQNNDANVSGLEWLKEKGYKVFDSKIWYSAKAPESTFFCKPIVEYAPRSWTALKYRKFVAEYLGEIEAEQAADLQEGKGVQ